MKTLHPSPSILEAFPEVRQPQSLGRGASLQVSVSVLIYVMRVSLLFLNELKLFIMPTGSLPAVIHRNVHNFEMFCIRVLLPVC